VILFREHRGQAGRALQWRVRHEREGDQEDRPEEARPHEPRRSAEGQQDEERRARRATTKLASGGISAQTQVAIKRLDDEDDPNSVPRAPEAQPERTSQGMTAQRPMSPAQKEQLRQLILRRPDANRFNVPQGGVRD